MADKRFRFLWIPVIISFCLCLGVMYNRISQEKANSTAEVLADYRSLCDQARALGVPVGEILKQCRENGITSIAVEEEGRDDLAQAGFARCLSSYELEDLQQAGRADSSVKTDPSCLYLLASSPEEASRLQHNGELALGKGRSLLVPGPGSNIVEIKDDMRHIAQVGFGIRAETVKMLADDYGFKVWLRPWNSPFISAEDIAAKLRELAELPGVEGIVFGGIRNEVLGFPDKLDVTAEIFASLPLKIGIIELAPAVQQKGIRSLARRLYSKAVRVMAVPPAQQQKLHPESSASMYSLGARERNIRLLYVRPYSDGAADMTMQETNDLFFAALKERLAGIAGAEATTFSGAVPQGPKWALVWSLISLGLFCAASLFLARFWSYELKYAVIGSIVLAMGVFGVCYTGIMMRHVLLMLAWGAATLMPVWGLVMLFPVFDKANGVSFGKSIALGWGALFFAGLFALAGGCYIAAFLPDPAYMLSIDVFRGVKLHGAAVPLAVMAVWIALQRERGGLQGYIKILNMQVKVWHVLVFAILGAAALFYLVRTGNSGGDAVVSESERAFRRWLDYVMGVRPRFKEFLLGNPALLLIPVFVRYKWNGLVPFALLAAAVGEASISDTYGHIHTPLLISLQRTALGIICGGIFGTFGAFIVAAVNKI
nr:DUF5693 family protein [bacterium]